MKNKNVYKALTLIFFLVTTLAIANAQCLPSFTFNLNANGNVSFTNTSTGATFPSYSWTFGDGNSSWLTNPNHSYSLNGSYTVCLTMFDSLGCQASICDTVDIQNAKSCQASFNAQVGATGYGFTNTSISTDPTSYYWTFGDGTSDTVESPFHTYNASGTYTVCLVISDSSGCSDTSCQVVTYTIGGGPCNASFSYSQTGGTNTIVFNNSSTGGGPGTNYSWNFGDGSSSSTFGPSHTYSTPGWYYVCLTMWDTVGCQSVACDSVLVSGGSGCSATFTYTTNPNSSFVFIPTVTGNPPITYSWDLGDGTMSNMQSPNHLYASPGTYYVCLTIADNSGCTATFCDSVLYQGTGSNCQANFSYYDSSGIVVFSNTSTGGVNSNYSWSFGDGSFSTITNPNHNYGGSGPFVVCLSMSDSLGCQSVHCDTITLNSIGKIELEEDVQLLFYLSANDLNVRSISNAEILQIAIIDLQGREVAEKIERTKNIRVNHSFLTSHVYLVRVTTTSGIHVRKVALRH